VAGVLLLLLAPSAPGTGGTAGNSAGNSAGNEAFANAAATRQVTAEVSSDLAGIYSYDYTDLSATTDRARQVLAGQAAAQYAELARSLNGAVGEKLVVSTTVASAGVESLTPDSATLLVFLIQHATRAGKAVPAVAGQLQVTARRAGTRWLITTISAR
jgi:hypothetical protein